MDAIYVGIGIVVSWINQDISMRLDINGDKRQYSVISIDRPGRIISEFGLAVGFGWGNVAIRVLTITWRFGGNLSNAYIPLFVVSPIVVNLNKICLENSSLDWSVL